MDDTGYDMSGPEARTWFVGRIDDVEMLFKLEEVVAAGKPKKVYLMGGHSVPEEGLESLKKAISSAGGSCEETQLGVRHGALSGYCGISLGNDMISLGRAPSWKVLARIGEDRFGIEEARNALESMLSGDVSHVVIAGPESMYAHIENSVLDSDETRGMHASWPAGKPRSWSMPAREPTIIEVGPLSHGLIAATGEKKDGYVPIKYLRLG